MKLKSVISGALLFPLCIFANNHTVLNVKDFGLMPDVKSLNASIVMKTVCDSAHVLSKQGKKVVIKFEQGKYFFQPSNCTRHTYYISNHDQINPKSIGIAIEDFCNLTLEGNGAELIFDGQMLPLSLIGSKDCVLRNFSIDFAIPHIAQAEIVSNDFNGNVKYRMADWDQWWIDNGVLKTKGNGWQYHADYAIAFDGDTRHIVPQTSDIYVHTTNLTVEADSTICSCDWKDCSLKPGTRLALRTWDRPTPAIFLADDVRTSIKNVKVHYAEGMGLLAQMCEDIDIDAFSVCLKGDDDPRYFTTQADATHFSGCKGLICERNGIFEGMMDDAINVHGTYLKITSVESSNTIIGQYMHDQTFGFRWGEAGDTIRIVRSKTMEYEDYTTQIESIVPVDGGINNGVKSFRIVLNDKLPENIDIENCVYGIENITWTPKVIFENNIVRNNRARGALFSTPKSVIARGNLFDHTSGCAILLCGDCNGWFETGPCTDVLITKNKFVNALTNMFQFTNAVISIYPEIPDLDGQKKYFHQNVMIVDNDFETFDYPLLYAKSVDGLIFCNNRIKYNRDFKPFHYNKQSVLLEHVVNAAVSNNEIVSEYKLVDEITQ